MKANFPPSSPFHPPASRDRFPPTAWPTNPTSTQMARTHEFSSKGLCPSGLFPFAFSLASLPVEGPRMRPTDKDSAGLTLLDKAKTSRRGDREYETTNLLDDWSNANSVGIPP